MQSRDPGEKIVKLDQHPRRRQQQTARQPPTPRRSALLQRCENLTVERLGIALRRLFENLDDALFDMAERAESSQVQAEYFEGMRELRRNRHRLEGQFKEEINRSFDRFARRERTDPAGQQPSTPIDRDSLSLVDDEQLEDQLAIDELVSRAESQCGELIYTLSQRFAALRGEAELEAGANPIEPANLAQAFQTATTQLTLAGSVRLIVYKQYERFVVSRLTELYQAVNAVLIDAGVLPDLKSQVPSRGDGDPAADGSGEGTRSQASEEQLFDALRSLLAQHRGPTPTHAGTTTAGSLAGDQGHDSAGSHEGVAGGVALVPADTAQLLGALSQLQQQLPRGGMRGQGIAAVLPAERMKTELLGRVDDGSAGKLSQPDEDCIDLVGMLFDYVLSDENLPHAIRSLLARLQIPYLKVALLDQALFSQPEHPARQLLDELAQAGLGWSEEGDRDRRLYNKLRTIVERVLNNFQKDLQVFAELVEELREFRKQDEQRAAVAERRAAEAAHGREQLELARSRAAAEIRKRIERHRVPQTVRAVLTRPWANVLVLTQLRHDTDSDQWRRAVKTMDALVWAFQPKTQTHYRERLEQLRPPLQRALRQGLGLVAYNEADGERLVNAVDACLDHQLGAADRQAVDETPQTLAEDDLPGEDIVERYTSSDDAATSAVQLDEACDAITAESLPEAVEELDIGTWVELRHADGDTTRAKLSWISPISARHLFVSHKGLKVADKAPEELAEDLRNGRVRMITDEPLFTRAMGSIMEKLREGQPPATA